VVDRGTLRQLLEKYEPADAREAGHLRRMASLLRDGEPFARTSFDPGHFTASAFVLSPEGGEVALIFHKKLRIWVQPGGHAESADASLSAAARREVGEEIGVYDLLGDPEEGDREVPIFDVDVHPIPARRDEPAHEHFDVRFRFTARSRALRASDEVEGVRWVPLSEVHSLASDESVQRAVRKLTARPGMAFRPPS
jgi:8-oxo-dGTP pyrophosphatase MutT (NUDIX family)